jgi:uncharacterized protein with HEPN domain
MLSAAIERKFEIIGESLARIRRERPSDLVSIGEWPAIIGFRNILGQVEKGSGCTFALAPSG